jgi:hypothetical protein
MSDDKKAQVDSKTILMTLDQIGQTIDIMTSVVGRLRGYITEQAELSTHKQQADIDMPHPYPERSQTRH